MSFLKDFSPKRTRQKQGEPQRSTKLPEVRSNPVQEILPSQTNPDDYQKPEVVLKDTSLDVSPQQEMVKEYKYNPEEVKDIKKVQSAQIKTEQIEELKCPVFGLYELLPMCEEHLLTYMYGVQDPKLKKIQELGRDYLYQKMELISDSKKEISFGSFKDNLYYYKDEVILPEELAKMSGFLREYFQIEHIAILYKTGEILLQDSGYCNFWFGDRLDRFFSGKLRELNHTEIQNDNNCLDCIYNYNCPFSKINHTD